MKILFLIIFFLGCANATQEEMDPSSTLGVIINLNLIRPAKCRSYPASATSTYVSGTNVTTSGTLVCIAKREILGLSCKEDLGNGTQNQYIVYYSSLSDYVEEAVQFRNYKHKIEYSSPSVVSESFTTDSERRIVTNVNSNGSNVTLTYSAWDGLGRPTTGIYQAPGCNPGTITVFVDANSYFFSSNIAFTGGGGSCPASNVSVRTNNQFDSNFFLTKKEQILSINGSPFNTTQSLYATQQSETYCYH
jgi:hypothetical protein